MRILVISNFYPPHFIGGYDLACREVVDALAARGHEVYVLTSTYGIGRRQRAGNVWRWLTTDLGWNIEEFHRYLIRVMRRELADQRAFGLMCKKLRPHVVYAWNLRHITLSLCLRAQRMGLPVCYFVFDDSFCDLEKDPACSFLDHQPRRFFRRLCWEAASPLLRRAGVLPESSFVDVSHVQFASHYLKNAALRTGKPVAGAKVIYYGVDVNRYRFKMGGAQSGRGRLLYVGQIAPHKGVHTAVKALDILVRGRRIDTVSLTIVGGSIFPDYEAELHRLVARLGLERKVDFVGQISREELASLYANYDVLLFPSVWEEPFGIVPLEAMASGVPVVGTATGGAMEVLEHEVNALVFPRGDEEACTNCIQRLLEDDGLYERIRVGGRLTVEERFRFERTIDELEQDLGEIVERRSAREPVGRPQ